MSWLKKDKSLMLFVHPEEFRVYVDHHGQVDMQLESTEPHYKMTQTAALNLIAELSVALMRDKIKKGE